MSTERTPLLSDIDIERMSGDPINAQAVSKYAFGECIGRARGLVMARDIYEAARAKDAELIQELFDALVQPIVSVDAPLEMMCRAKGAIELAYAAGFTPTTENE